MVVMTQRCASPAARAPQRLVENECSEIRTLSSPPRKRGSRAASQSDQDVPAGLRGAAYRSPLDSRFRDAFAGMTMKTQHIGKAQFISSQTLRMRTFLNAIKDVPHPERLAGNECSEIRRLSSPPRKRGSRAASQADQEVPLGVRRAA